MQNADVLFVLHLLRNCIVSCSWALQSKWRLIVLSHPESLVLDSNV